MLRAAAEHLSLLGSKGDGEYNIYPTSSCRVRILVNEIRIKNNNLRK